MNVKLQACNSTNSLVAIFGSTCVNIILCFAFLWNDIRFSAIDKSVEGGNGLLFSSPESKNWIKALKIQPIVDYPYSDFNTTNLDCINIDNVRDMIKNKWIPYAKQNNISHAKAEIYFRILDNGSISLYSSNLSIYSSDQFLATTEKMMIQRLNCVANGFERKKIFNIEFSNYSLLADGSILRRKQKIVVNHKSRQSGFWLVD